jgi:hypothetical protein
MSWDTRELSICVSKRNAYETETRLGWRRIDGVELGGRDLSAYDDVDNSKNSADLRPREGQTTHLQPIDYSNPHDVLIY